MGSDETNLQAENRLLESADLVIATSEETARDFRARQNRSIVVLGNGVDWKSFDVGRRPAVPIELADIPKPRIGYVGAINEKFDFDLILLLAKRRPNWQFVLVGPVGNLLPGDTERIAELKCCRNVHFFGPVPQRRIPEFLLSLDVGLVCYRLLDWTLAGYPLKMLEYLACGLAVVSSNLPAVRKYGEMVAIAESPDQWESELCAAIAGRGKGDPASRLAVAKANGWEMRVADLERHLDCMVTKANRAGVSQTL
jgi:glycosyltransferase involved in cell wall biosynthesis